MNHKTLITRKINSQLNSWNRLFKLYDPARDYLKVPNHMRRAFFTVYCMKNKLRVYSLDGITDYSYSPSKFTSHKEIADRFSGVIILDDVQLPPEKE